MNVPVWEDGTWDPLGTVPPGTTLDADMCVVGLGGSGLAAVGAGIDAGLSVVGVDAGVVGGGAAGRNGGFLLAGMARFHHDAVAAWGEDTAAGLYAATLAEIERLADELGEVGVLLRRVGSLRLPPTEQGDGEAEDCARHLDALRRSGFPGEAWDGGGLLIPGDAVLDPLARCRHLARRAMADGADLFEGTPLVGASGTVVGVGGGARIRLRIGTVVAIDGGLERVLPSLTVPAALYEQVRSTRLQMLATAPVPIGTLPRPVYLRYGYDYAQQLPDGRIAAGGRRDRHEAEEWGADPEPTDAVQAGIECLLRDTLGIVAPVTHRWAGEVSYTADHLPLLAAFPSRLAVCGAYSGHGNVLGSMCGRAAVDLLLGRRSPWADLVKTAGSFEDGRART